MFLIKFCYRFVFILSLIISCRTSLKDANTKPHPSEQKPPDDPTNPKLIPPSLEEVKAEEAVKAKKLDDELAEKLKSLAPALGESEKLAEGILERGNAHAPTGVTQTREAKDKDLTILQIDKEIAYVLNGLEKESAANKMEVETYDDLKLKKIVEVKLAENVTDYVDVYVSIQGIKKLIARKKIPLLIAKNGKPYRAEFAFNYDASKDNKIGAPLENFITELIFDGTAGEVFLFPEIVQDKFDPEKEYVLRFVSTGYDGNLDFTKNKNSFKQAINYPIHPERGLPKISAAGITKYNDLQKTNPNMLEAISKTQIANCEMTALAALQWNQFTNYTVIIGHGYSLKNSFEIDLDAENHAWNMFYNSRQTDFSSLLSFDLTPPINAMLEYVVEDAMVDEINSKIAIIAELKKFMLPTITRSTSGVIIGISEDSDFVKKLPENDVKAIKEIYDQNREDNLLKQVLETNFPKTTHEIVTSVVKADGLIFKEELCKNTLCYKKKGVPVYTRIIVDNHYVNYAPLGSLAFFVPKSEKIQVKEWAYRKQTYSGELPERTLFTSELTDLDRQHFFNFSTPLLESAFADNLSYGIQVANDSISTFARAEPKFPNPTDGEWFGINWKSFKNRILKTQLLKRSIVTLDKFSLVIPRQPGWRNNTYMDDYLKSFPLKNEAEYRAALKTADDPGYNTADYSNLKFISLQTSYSPPIYFKPIYHVDPVETALQEFWVKRNGFGNSIDYIVEEMHVSFLSYIEE